MSKLLLNPLNLSNLDATVTVILGKNIILDCIFGDDDKRRKAQGDG